MPVYLSNSTRNHNSSSIAIDIRDDDAFPALKTSANATTITATTKQTHSVSQPYSKVMLGLTDSQGSLALISALLAGFSFQGLSTMDFGSYDDTPVLLQEAFAITISLSIALNLYVAVNCTILEQNGKIARSLAISDNTPENFDETIRVWYSDAEFVKFRIRLVKMFTLSFLFFASALALYSVIKLRNTVEGGGYVCMTIFSIFGVKMLHSILYLNRMFLNKILKNGHK